MSQGMCDGVHALSRAGDLSLACNFSREFIFGGRECGRSGKREEGVQEAGVLGNRILLIPNILFVPNQLQPEVRVRSETVESVSVGCCTDVQALFR